MPSIRKGVAFTIGLVSFPVDVRSAIRSDTETSLNIICNNGHDPVGIKQPRVCPVCRDDTDSSTFVRGRVDGDTVTVLDAEQIAALAPAAEVTTEMHFTVHPSTDVDALTLPNGAVYYLAGHKNAIAYNAIREALELHPEHALLTRWAPRSNVSLYRLVILRGQLAIAQCAWPYDVEQAPAPPVVSNHHDKFVAQLGEAFAAWSVPLEELGYVNDRAEALAAMLAEAQGTAVGTVPARAKPKAVAEDTSLLDALTASLAKPKRTRKKTA